MAASQPTASGSATPNGVRIATLNIWGRHGNWAARRPVLTAALQRLQPDIIAVQESVVVDSYDQAADVLGPAYHIVHLRGRSDDGTGASIASRWPMRTVREVDLHLTPRVDAAAGWIGSATVLELSVPNAVGTLLLVHHKPSWQWGFERERELQAVATAQVIEELVGQRSIHVVLLGDFDAPPDAASVRFWRGRQALGDVSVCYADAWESTHPGDPGHTFSPRNPLVRTGEMPLERGRRIDYIMVRCGSHGPTLEVADCSLVLDEPSDGVWASDHFGVVADLQVPTRPVEGARQQQHSAAITQTIADGHELATKQE